MSDQEKWLTAYYNWLGASNLSRFVETDHSLYLPTYLCTLRLRPKPLRCSICSRLITASCVHGNARMAGQGVSPQTLIWTYLSQIAFEYSSNLFLNNSAEFPNTLLFSSDSLWVVQPNIEVTPYMKYPARLIGKQSAFIWDLDSGFGGGLIINQASTLQDSS